MEHQRTSLLASGSTETSAEYGTASSPYTSVQGPQGFQSEGPFGKYFWQTVMLTKKNYLCLRRKLGMTLLILLAPFLFMALLVIIDQGYRAAPEMRERRSTVHSFSEQSAKLQRCIPPPDKSCYTIGYAPTGAPYDNLVNQVAQRYAIPASEIRGWSSTADANDWIYNNPNITQAAYFFYTPVNTTGTSPTLEYTIVYNNSKACTVPNICNAPMDKVVVPMMIGMDAVLFQETFAVSLHVNTVAMPRQELVILNVVNAFGAPLMFLCIIFVFLSLLSLITHEKENKLRLTMDVMGLRRLPFWLSWFAIAFVLLFAVVLVLITSGAMFQMTFFLKNAFGNYFFLLMLTGFGIIAMGFLMSVFLTTSKAATSASFLYFLSFWIIVSFANNILYNQSIDVPEWLRVLGALFPPVLLYKGLGDLSQATTREDSSGISWAERGTYTDIFPLEKLFNYAILDFFIYVALLTYFDHTVAGDYGISERHFFFLYPSYWGFRSSTTNRQKQKEAARVQAERMRRERERRKTLNRVSMQHAPYMNPANPHSSIVSASGRIDDIDDDVADEAEYVCSDDGIDQYLLRVVNLQKVYEGSGGCCGCGKSKTYHAVRGISFGIKPNELFCMLGANGAGKSTTFSMLTGVHGITSGEAFVDGLCVGEDMDAIRLRMGVCPQHDILWPELTAAEHLELMAAVKGMKHSLIRDEVQRRLDGVHLGSVANVVAGSFSGGMRRRLSVAVSLIGDPKVIYLDEPSTGLDPVSRRALWTMFQEAKRGRAMLLTTHSMEEADALGDRVTILAKGRMRSIGTSLHLKQKYGAGYRLAFTMPELAEKPAIQNFMRNSLPMATVVYDVGSVIVFQIPRELSPRLADFFRALENQQEFPRAEYSVSITTLEEVFFEISEMARLEEARAKVGAEEKKR